MKKAAFLLAMMTMIFFSCKKDHSASTIPSGKKYQVTFNVLNFQSKQSSLALRTGSHLASGDTLTNLNGYLDVLYYVVYSSDGHAIRMPLMQDSTMSNMGTITDSLPAGIYQVAIVTGKKGLAINSYGIIANANFGYGNYLWQDTFWGTFTLTVGSGDNINEAVLLSRVVGKLEVQILDNVPAAADSLSITINPEILSKQIDQGSNNASTPTESFVYTVPIPASAKGKPNFTIDKLIGDTQDINTITLAYKDASNHIVDTAKVINNVVFRNDTKTILSGNMCSGMMNGSQQSFTVKADTAWGSDITLGFSLRLPKKP